MREEIPPSAEISFKQRVLNEGHEDMDDGCSWPENREVRRIYTSLRRPYRLIVQSIMRRSMPTRRSRPFPPLPFLVPLPRLHQTTETVAAAGSPFLELP